MRGRHILLICLWLGSFSLYAQQPVEKTNEMKVYMHYMPWFETPETVGRWGWHWTMNNKNPHNVDAQGKREIASHYYPLIGPYASRDKDVIEYHLLLMKLAGVDGVLINWYGVQGSNGDIQSLLTSSDAIVSYVDDFGLEFGVVMEDRFSRSIEDVKANMAYLKENYFTKPQYINYGASEDPLVGIFGPITFEEPAQWEEISAAIAEDIEFLTLWYESAEAGVMADGEYAWIFQDHRNHMDHLKSFYTDRAPELETAMGVAYPGFVDFYQEGNAGSGYFTIPHKEGATLAATLKMANQYKENINMLQLATWNDFGEGTVFEPTLETGFEYLKQVQDFTGVEYGEDELKLVYKLFQLRKEFSSDNEVQEQLDLAAEHLVNLKIEEAENILSRFEVTGLLDGDTFSDKIHEVNLHVYPNPLSDSLLNIEFQGQQGKSTRLSILSLLGKVIIQKELPVGTSSASLSIEGLEEGIYILELQFGGKKATQKLIVN